MNFENESEISSYIFPYGVSCLLSQTPTSCIRSCISLDIFLDILYISSFNIIIEGVSQMKTRCSPSPSYTPLSRCPFKGYALKGCNIGSKTLLVLAERGKLPLKLTCRASTSTFPATLLYRVELHCEYSAQNNTRRERQVRALFYLPVCRFSLNSLATCTGAIGYVARSLTLPMLRLPSSNVHGHNLF